MIYYINVTKSHWVEAVETSILPSCWDRRWRLFSEVSAASGEELLGPFWGHWQSRKPWNTISLTTMANYGLYEFGAANIYLLNTWNGSSETLLLDYHNFRLKKSLTGRRRVVCVSVYWGCHPHRCRNVYPFFVISVELSRSKTFSTINTAGFRNIFLFHNFCRGISIHEKYNNMERDGDC